jgi:hypothetical protein
MLVLLKVIIFFSVGVQVFSTLQLWRYERRKRIFQLPSPYMLPDGTIGTKMSYYVREGPGNKQKRIFWFCCTMLSGAVVILGMTTYQYLA